MPDMALSSSLATLTATLTEDFDVATTIQAAVSSCEHIGASAVGVLVEPEPGRLEIMAASSHAVHLLEVYQALCEQGPCVDVLRIGIPVTESGVGIVGRWPEAGQAITEAGFHSVLAVPLKWRGETLGGMNLFFDADEPIPDDLVSTAQGIADIVTIAILHADDLPTARSGRSALQSALSFRTVVERAKGVIAQQDTVDMGEAFARLLGASTSSRTSITRTAQAAIDAAERGRYWGSTGSLA